MIENEAAIEGRSNVEEWAGFPNWNEKKTLQSDWEYATVQQIEFHGESKFFLIFCAVFGGFGAKPSGASIT